MEHVQENDSSDEVVMCEGLLGFKSSFPGGELTYRQRGDLAIHGFENLIYKLDPDDEESHSSLAQEESSTISPKDEANFKKDLMHRLRSVLLPNLRQSVIKILLSPDPAHLPKEPGEKLKEILKGQSELDHSWDQIQRSVHKLCHESSQDSSSQANDGHLKDLKRFRLDRLSSLFEDDLLEDIILLFKYTLETIQRRGLSNFLPLAWNNNFYHLKDAFTSQHHTKYTASVLKTIDSMVCCIEGTELDIVQRDWPRNTRRLDDYMQQLLHLIDPTVSSNEAGRYPADTIPLSQPGIRVAKSVLTIIKISRIFFNKLSKRGINNKRLPLFTEMSSDELEAFSKVPSQIVHDLKAIISCLRRGDGGVIQLPQITKRLRKRFRSSLALITAHFIPLIPDTDNFPDRKKYYKTWFNVTWSTHFDLAISDLMNSARILHPNVS
ncbi:hypothetical protein MJO28_015622 [Puccinia striiformis f. sp. tritici]|uniref:Uncharacterized protein n=1 Tax=Puccinia striiformis f. sp. tritici TaxID=168172 RepID=A0ACC0DPG5_9BASI|nr:hypothetical protein MJO28_015622 [Puccinia striiformis f. sp. tritici]